MEPEQIEKRLEWLDAEHRKDKATIAALEERLRQIENNQTSLTKRVEDFHKDVDSLASAAARLNQFDDVLSKERADATTQLAEYDKKRQRREREVERGRKADLDEIKGQIAGLKSKLEDKRSKEKSGEALRLNQTINELKTRLDAIAVSNEEALRTFRASEETRLAESKRIADWQGELSATRKRVDELRQKLDLASDSLRFMDTRLVELLNAENDRRQTQSSFIDQQNQTQAERDRSWRDWKETFATFKKQTEFQDAQLQALDATHRAIKQSQDRHEELNAKIERRINEITEMQRLAEDRMRQEWVTFKSDDQKRWTGYTLSQEEALREIRQNLQKLTDRVTNLDDLSQTLYDQLQQTTDSTEQQMQELMNWAHQWLEAYERIMGHTRKSR